MKELDVVTAFAKNLAKYEKIKTIARLIQRMVMFGILSDLKMIKGLPMLRF
jgi:hypothetical protein